MSKVVRGSCLCGGVRFEVEPPFIRAGHCHCERCRKHSGTAVCTQARVKKQQFRLLQGEDLIRVYGKGEGAVKAFCINCGSSLFGGDWPEGDQVSIRMGAFDDDPGIRPQFHTFVDDRVPWDKITDDLPQYPGALMENAQSRSKMKRSARIKHLLLTLLVTGTAPAGMQGCAQTKKPAAQVKAAAVGLRFDQVGRVSLYAGEPCTPQIMFNFHGTRSTVWLAAPRRETEILADAASKNQRVHISGRWRRGAQSQCSYVEVTGAELAR